MLCLLGFPHAGPDRSLSRNGAGSLALAGGFAGVVHVVCTGVGLCVRYRRRTVKLRAQNSKRPPFLDGLQQNQSGRSTPRALAEPYLAHSTVLCRHGTMAWPVLHRVAWQPAIARPLWADQLPVFIATLLLRTSLARRCDAMYNIKSTHTRTHTHTDCNGGEDRAEEYSTVQKGTVL